MIYKTEGYIYAEKRNMVNGTALSWDLSHHLYARYRGGPVVIISSKPTIILPALRKQWVKIVSKLRNEYSRTLNPAKREELDRTIRQMEAMPFKTSLPDKQVCSEHGVYIISPDDVRLLTVKYATIYTIDIGQPDIARPFIAKYGALVSYC